MFKPQTLEGAYELAESEKKKVEALRRRNSYMKSNFSPKPVQNRIMGRPNSDPKMTTNHKGKQHSAEFKKRQCFKCGDK